MSLGRKRQETDQHFANFRPSKAVGGCKKNHCHWRTRRPVWNKECCALGLSRQGTQVEHTVTVPCGGLWCWSWCCTATAWLGAVKSAQFPIRATKSPSRSPVFSKTMLVQGWTRWSLRCFPTWMILWVCDSLLSYTSLSTMRPTAFLSWENIFEAFNPIILCKAIMLSWVFSFFFLYIPAGLRYSSQNFVFIKASMILCCGLAESGTHLMKAGKRFAPFWRGNRRPDGVSYTP